MNVAGSRLMLPMVTEWLGRYTYIVYIFFINCGYNLSPNRHMLVQTYKVNAGTTTIITGNCNLGQCAYHGSYHYEELYWNHSLGSWIA